MSRSRDEIWRYRGRSLDRTVGSREVATLSPNAIPRGAEAVTASGDVVADPWIERRALRMPPRIRLAESRGEPVPQREGGARLVTRLASSARSLAAAPSSVAKLQRDQRGVKGDATLQEVFPGLSEGPLSLDWPAKARVNPPLKPAKPDQPEPKAELDCHPSDFA
jgi:hypothetical protein